eukprot:4495735-Karenia_brevis.AAC.1
MPHKRSYFRQSGSWTQQQISRWRRDVWYRLPSNGPAQSRNADAKFEVATETDNPAITSGSSHRYWADIDDDDIPECWEECLHDGLDERRDDQCALADDENDDEIQDVG